MNDKYDGTYWPNKFCAGCLAPISKARRYDSAYCSEKCQKREAARRHYARKAVAK